MNVFAKNLTAARPLDAVRAMPRRVMGFHVLIETDMDLEDLRASLEGLAENSAFNLTELTECAGITHDQGRAMCAEFSLAASMGTVGDPQIFSLLRDIAAKHRWNEMQKRIEV